MSTTILLITDVSGFFFLASFWVSFGTRLLLFHLSFSWIILRSSSFVRFVQKISGTTLRCFFFFVAPQAGVSVNKKVHLHFSVVSGLYTRRRARTARVSLGHVMCSTGTARAGRESLDAMIAGTVCCSLNHECKENTRLGQFLNGWQQPAKCQQRTGTPEMAKRLRCK